MAPRSELQSLLEDVLGSRNVYFQPPPSIQMSYPCIVYRRDDVRMSQANNKTYKEKVRYQVTIIDRNPDSDIPKQLRDALVCTFDRSFSADNLNHDVYNLFF